MNMKHFLSTLTLAAGLFMAANLFADPPTVVASGATGVSSSAATISGTVNPNGSNTVAWFRYGTTASFGSTTTNVNVGSNSSPVAVTYALSGLTGGGTKYYFTLVASNSVELVTGATYTFVTTSVSYDYVAGSGVGSNGWEVNRPYGSEPGSVWDDALRQVKAAVTDAITRKHTTWGDFIPGAISSNDIAAKSIFPSHLADAVFTSVIFSNIATATITGATLYVWNQESGFSSIPAVRNVDTVVCAGSLASNRFRYAHVTAEIVVNNSKSAKYSIQPKFRVATVPAKDFGAISIGAGVSTIIPLSFFMSAGNTTAQAVDFTISGLEDCSACTFQAENMRIWGIQ